MRTVSTFFLLFAAATTIFALPTPQKVNEDANERANDGAKAVENEIKIQESIALTKAGCGGAIIKGAECEKIDAEFQAKLADALGTDDAAAKDAAAADNKDAAAADNKDQKAEGKDDKKN